MKKCKASSIRSCR